MHDTPNRKILLHRAYQPETKCSTPVQQLTLYSTRNTRLPEQKSRKAFLPRRVESEATYTTRLQVSWAQFSNTHHTRSRKTCCSMEKEFLAVGMKMRSPTLHPSIIHHIRPRPQGPFPSNGIGRPKNRAHRFVSFPYVGMPGVRYKRPAGRNGMTDQTPSEKRW